MRSYFGQGQDTSTASTTIVQLKQPGTALKRLAITSLTLGSSASADSAYKAYLQKTTDAGTPGSTFTAIPRDPADGAASGVFNVAHSVEPTYTANAIHLVIPAHQRATFQWFCQPGHEIIIPVTNDAGVGLLINTSATPFSMSAGIEWEE